MKKLNTSKQRRNFGLSALTDDELQKVSGGPGISTSPEQEPSMQNPDLPRSNPGS